MSNLEGFSAVGYCRVSTDDKGQTNETQVREIKKWAEKNGVSLLKIFEEEMTGTTLDRPILMQTIGYIRFNAVPILVVYDQSRLTRNEDLPKIREQLGTCQIRYASSDIDPNSLGGRLNDAIRQVMDHEENLIRSQKTKIGMETRRRAGIHTGRPYSVVFAEEIENLPKNAVNFDDTDKTRKGLTRVLQRADVLLMADYGYSLGHTAKVLNIPKVSFYDACKRVNLTEEYNHHLEVAKNGNSL